MSSWHSILLAQSGPPCRCCLCSVSVVQFLSKYARQPLSCCAALWRRSETFPSQPDLHSDSERPDVSGCCRFRLVVEGETVDTERRLETRSRQGRCCEDETRRQENKTNPVFWFPSMFKRRVAEPNMIKQTSRRHESGSVKNKKIDTHSNQ